MDTQSPGTQAADRSVNALGSARLPLLLLRGGVQPVIPEAAVEAAHKAWREQARQNGTIFEYNLRAALEAAAPHMLAEAWEAGAKATDEYERQCRFNSNYGDDLPQPPINPYRGEESKTTILRMGDPDAKWEDL